MSSANAATSDERAMHEIPADLARAFRDLEAAARYYVEEDWSAWNNMDGHDWPKVRAALAAIDEART